MTHSDLVKSVQFDLLGQLQIRIGARMLRPGGRRAQALLAALLLEAGRSVSVSRLAETVWGDATPRTAPAQVRNRVSNLRQLLRAAGALRPTGGLGPDTRYQAEIDEGNREATRVAELRQRGDQQQPGNKYPGEQRERGHLLTEELGQLAG